MVRDSKIVRLSARGTESLPVNPHRRTHPPTPRPAVTAADRRRMVRQTLLLRGGPGQFTTKSLDQHGTRGPGHYGCIPALNAYTPSGNGASFSNSAIILSPRMGEMNSLTRWHSSGVMISIICTFNCADAPCKETIAEFDVAGQGSGEHPAGTWQHDVLSHGEQPPES